ncbi:MAG: threonine synthase [Bacteroidia bacterium]
MNYFSLNGISPPVDFKQALYNGMAPDGSLYFPDKIPRLSPSWLKTYKGMEKAQIAFDVMLPFTGSAIPEEELYRICEETCSFDFPLHPVQDSISSLELYHGPTMAFKDVGARFMSRCLSWFVRQENRRVTVLVATSGDTGAAVANGFAGMDGIDVVVLYPSGKVSRFQELQMACGLKNVHALEVNGNFDDCQRMVKEAFADTDLRSRKFITSANSINIARWLPQQIYYFLALKAWPFADSPVISVPSGNFGNLCAGLMAQVSGLPVRHFIAACNSNKVFTHYLESGNYSPAPAVNTISSAMDVGDPSNFSRILELFQKSHERLCEKISSISVNDHTTAETLWAVNKNSDYLMDPHGAVAFFALKMYLDEHPGEKGIFLETAHPAKFGEVMECITGIPVVLPERMKKIMAGEKQSIFIQPVYKSLKDFLLGGF